MYKRLILAVAMVAVAFGAGAASEKVGDYTWTYRIVGRTAEITTGYYSAAITPKPTGVVTIPSKLGEKPVTSIGREAFYYCSGMTGVIIPESVTIIDNEAFRGCSGLKTVIIPDGVVSIGDRAFVECSGLRTVTIPVSVVSIGEGAFSGCSGLEEIKLPFIGSRRGNSNSFDSVLGHLFGSKFYSGCSLVQQYYSPHETISTNVYVPSSLTKVEIADETVLGYGALSGFRGLTRVSIPPSVTNIEDRAFMHCSGLLSVAIPDSVMSIGANSFIGCSSITNVTIPDSVASINEWMFGGCVGLRGVSIGNGVTTIERYAFDGCNGLANLMIPCNVTNIGESAFAYCKGLKDVKIFNSAISIGNKAFEKCESLSSVYIPVEYTGSTVEFPSEATILRYKMNQTALLDASGGNVSPASLKVRWQSAYGELPIPFRTGYSFADWTYQGQVVSNDTLVLALDDHVISAQWKVNQYAQTFNANGGIGGKTVLLDYGATLVALAVTRIGYTLTGWSPSLPSAVPAANATYTAQWQANTYTVTFDPNGGTVSPATKIVTFDDVYGTLPIPKRKYCTFVRWKLGDKAVAKTVKVATASDHTLVAQWSRYGAELTSSQIVGKKLSELYPNDYANLTTVVLKNGITELPDGFFDGCDNVEFVTWPSTLLEFGIEDLPSKIRASLAYDENGFMIYNGWILDYQNRRAAGVTIPDGVVGIGRGAFAAMFDLETVTMPESLKCVAKGAFEDCSYIQNLQFMSGIRYVGPETFRGCSSLRGATFADGVEQIGANAFADCWKMISVRLPFTVTNIGINAFSGCSAIRGVTVPTQVETMQALFPAAYTKIETAEVAEGETSVMDDMFAGCTALRGGATQTDMSMIPNTVTNIGARAFQGCTSLTAFVVPDSVTEIGEAVFLGCTSLWNVTLSRNLAAIPDKAFYGCTKLETMVVPQKVNYLGDRFFCGKDNGANALYYLCTNAPACHASAYAAISGNMTTYVEQGSRSWDGRQGSRDLPQTWNGYPIRFWTPNRFDVIFDANGGRFDTSGGSTWSEQQITDTAYALPSTEPTRPGWAFEGWWTEQTGGAEVRYTTKVTATRTHTLYAHWRSLGKTMTVKFNSNGGTVVTPGSQDYVPGQTFGQFPVPTRRGYTFQGWWTEAVAGVHMAEATQVPAADMELFAHWSPITYVIRFHANGGNGGDVDQTFVFDVQKALASHTFTRTGFAFTGWATTPGGQVRYAENASVVNLEEVQDYIVDLYAVWSGVGYSVRFDSNGGTGIMDNQTIAVDETQNLWPCVFARAGYAFVGWAVSPTEAETKTVKYRDGQAVRNLATSNGATVTLYAVWVAKSNTVRITFDANGGSVAPGYWDCVINTAVEAFPTATRPGFTFADWWTAKTGGTRVASIASVTSSKTFYAHWTENGGVEPGDGSYVVTFNANGGSVSPTSRTVTGGSAVGTLPTPSRTGYRFLGWFAAASGGNPVTATTKVTGKVTYYAHWQPVYAIRFHRNDASDEKVETRDFDYGEETHLPSLAKLGWARRGCDFLGWATSRANADAGKVWKADWALVSTDAAVGQTLDVYAVWALKPGSYAIEFIRNDGAGTWRTVGFNYGEKTRIPSVANGLGWARRGYDFKGWARTTADANAGMVWKGDWAYVSVPFKAGEIVPVYAVWALKPGYYQIRFNKNDGSGKWRTLGFECGKPTKLSTIAGLGWERPGKTFKGWAANKDKADGGMVWKSDGASVSSAAAEGKTLSIYAIWE